MSNPTPCLAALRRRLCPLLWVVALSTIGTGAFASTAELIKLTEQLDQLDKLDFDDAIHKAERCTLERDFDCAEAKLRSARKVATAPKSKGVLRQAEARLAAERELAESERLALARRQRELELAEARLKESEERAQRQAALDAENTRLAQESTDNTTASNIALFGSLLSQAQRNQAASRAADQARTRQFNQMQADVASNSARDQQRFAQERARLAAQRAELQQPAGTVEPKRLQVERQRAQVENEVVLARVQGAQGTQGTQGRRGEDRGAPGELSFLVGAAMSNIKSGEKFNLLERNVVKVRFTMGSGYAYLRSEEAAARAALSVVLDAYRAHLATRFALCSEGGSRPATGCFSPHLVVSTWQSAGDLSLGIYRGMDSEASARRKQLDDLPDLKNNGINSSPRVESTEFSFSASVTDGT